MDWLSFDEGIDLERERRVVEPLLELEVDDVELLEAEVETEGVTRVEESRRGSVSG